MKIYRRTVSMNRKCIDTLEGRPFSSLEELQSPCFDELPDGKVDRFPILQLSLSHLQGLIDKTQ